MEMAGRGDIDTSKSGGISDPASGDSTLYWGRMAVLMLARVCIDASDRWRSKKSLGRLGPTGVLGESC